MAKIQVEKTKKISRSDKFLIYNKIQNKRYKSLRFCINWRNKIKNNNWIKDFITDINDIFNNIYKEYKILKEKQINFNITRSDMNNNSVELIPKINYIIKQIRNTMNIKDTLNTLNQMKESID